jgi:hypothetical protein
MRSSLHIFAMSGKGNAGKIFFYWVSNAAVPSGYRFHYKGEKMCVCIIMPSGSGIQEHQARFNLPWFCLHHLVDWCNKTVKTVKPSAT